MVGDHPLWQDRPEAQSARGVSWLTVPNLYNSKPPNSGLFSEGPSAGEVLSADGNSDR